MKKQSWLFVIAIQLFAFPAIAVPASDLTVQTLRQSLLDVIQEIDDALAAATDDLKSVGESYEKNARGLIADIDERLGDKLEYTFDKLDDEGKQLFESAQELIRQSRTASELIVAQGGMEARRALAEADITAYNSSFSLPCRSWMPRFVYAEPEVVRVGRDRHEVRIRGNFLNTGSNGAASIQVDGKPARVIARSPNELRLAIPPEVFSSLQEERSIAIRAQLPEVRRKASFLFWCRESEVEPRSPQSIAVVVRPQDRIEVDARIVPRVASVERRAFSHRFRNDTGGSCSDRSRSVDRTVCVPDGSGWKLEGYSAPSIHSRNCGSHIGGHQQTGDKCVFIDATVRGCGYRRLPFGVRECRGRGWLEYSVALRAIRFGEDEIGESQDFRVDDDSEEMHTNFLFNYDREIGEGRATTDWTYEAEVLVTRAGKRQRIVVSDVDPNVAGITSRIEDGRLAVDVAGALTAN